MSNVGVKCLFKFGKSSLCYNGLCGNFIIEQQLIHTSDLDRNESRTSEQSHEDQFEQDRPSSSNHQFHRHSYERKRTDYQRERANNKQSNEPLISSAPSTHYQRLSVEPESDITTIKSAYYALSKKYHPDIVGEDTTDAAEQFRLITESYDILSDPISRRKYDSTLAPSPQTPQFTSWQPSGFNTNEQDHIFRMREANRIIKTRNDTFMQREKLKNPQKFRAGIFKFDGHQLDTQEEIDRLNRRIQSLDNYTSTFNSHKDSSNFYRSHLAGTIRRRREDLLEYRDLRKDSTTDDGILVTSILTVIAGIAFLSLVAVNQIYDIDIAAALDRKLQHALGRFKTMRRED